MARVRFGEAVRFWILLGFISFGGPAGQIAIMHRELVERRKWISEERFLHALNFCMLLPGPEAQQLATYIGWLLHRTVGGLIAGGFFVLPSVVLLLVLSWIYMVYGTVSTVAGALDGIKPVVVAIVIEAVLRIGRRAIRRRVHGAIAVAAFIGLAVLQIPFPVIIAAALLLGLLLPAGTLVQTLTPADGDEEPLPAHAQPDAARAWRWIATAFACWLVPLLLVTVWLGWDSLYVQLYRFFTGAAFVTFGGAYAVLAYVTDVATTSGWITPVQAVDGLALAETTPGPLIMVLQFVGFVTGWTHPGTLSPFAGALLAALLTTWATFLPCFAFIFVGAPYIERLRGNPAVASALAGVTAAVVGVVLNLAIRFAGAVFWPDGFAGGIAWTPVVVAVVATLALVRWHVSAPWVIVAGAVLGVLRAAM